MKWTIVIVGICMAFRTVVGQHYQHQDSLFFEVPDSADLHNPHFFNRDNRIYKPGMEFRFSYRIIKHADTLLVRMTRSGDTKTANWTLINHREADSLTIQFLSIKILDGYGGLDDLFPDYSQTILEQRYYSATRLLFEGSTGLIENPLNVWLHPFRGKYLSVLQFSPFPYIKLPANTHTTWTWELSDISERWSDSRIVAYSGKQQATYRYTITGEKLVSTELGLLPCYEVRAGALTSLGSTELIACFNTTYGFISLDYFNIDQSRIEIRLIGIN